MLVGLDICIDFVGVTVLDDLDGVFVISLVGWCLVGNLLRWVSCCCVGTPLSVTRHRLMLSGLGAVVLFGQIGLVVHRVLSANVGCVCWLVTGAVRLGRFAVGRRLLGVNLGWVRDRLLVVDLLELLLVVLFVALLALLLVM